MNIYITPSGNCTPGRLVQLLRFLVGKQLTQLTHIHDVTTVYDSQVAMQKCRLLYANYDNTVRIFYGPFSEGQ